MGSLVCFVKKNDRLEARNGGYFNAFIPVEKARIVQESAGCAVLMLTQAVSASEGPKPSSAVAHADNRPVDRRSLILASSVFVGLELAM